MNPPTLKPLIVPGYENESPATSLQSIVRKSALLNLTIILTSFLVLVFAGGPKAVVPTMAIMAGLSVLIWTPRSHCSPWFRLPGSSGLRSLLWHFVIPHIQRRRRGSLILGWTDRSDGHGQ